MSVEVKEQTEAVPFLGDGDGVKKPVEEKPEKIEVDVQLIDKDTSGGFWIFKGPILQRLATGTIFVAVFGITSCFMAMSFAYFNSTMTTLEKRYKIPTKVLGVLSTGNDISAMFSSIIIGYYLRNVHRPRWMGLGFLIITIFCIMNASLHFLYGAGEDALKLTHEFGNLQNKTGNSTASLSGSQLCTSEKTNCHMDIESWSPIIILFVAQLILGIGAGMVIIVGVAYMDDNTAKSKAPAMLTLSTFLRMMGPSAGYLLSSQCLKLYIDPRLSPLIKNTDPRWMGAWWLGYILLAVITLLSAFVIALFPKELPSAKARRLKQAKTDEPDPNNKHKAHSVSDMWKSVKGLAVNKVYVYNMAASIVYFFGYNVYWTFSQKYIEIQYRQSASVASMASGPVPLSFSAVGVVLSGYVIYKFKPGARAIVSWNVIVDFLTVAGILCYSLIGCKDSDQLGSMATTSNSCSASCHCDYAFYSPICSPNNVTYTTACHAGCTAMSKDPFDHDRKIYTGCSCISAPNITDTDVSHWQTAVGGHCPVDCTQQFYIFLVVMCFLKLVGASSKSTNFLISLRCIPPEQKSFGLGLGSMVTSLLAFIPSPIFYGWLIDKYCLVWGKTCSNKGNCWLYDTYSLRYVLNYTAATFVLLGGFCNIFVWYYAKHLQIFDENEETKLSLKRKEENILQGLGSTLQNKDHIRRVPMDPIYQTNYLELALALHLVLALVLALEFHLAIVPVSVLAVTAELALSTALASALAYRLGCLLRYRPHYRPACVPPFARVNALDCEHAFGLAFVHAFGDAFAFVMRFGFAFAPAFGFALGFAFGLPFALAFAPPSSLRFGPRFHLAIDLPFVLAFLLVCALEFGLAFHFAALPLWVLALAHALALAFELALSYALVLALALDEVHGLILVFGRAMTLALFLVLAHALVRALVLALALALALALVRALVLAWALALVHVFDLALDLEFGLAFVLALGHESAPLIDLLFALSLALILALALAFGHALAL